MGKGICIKNTIRIFFTSGSLGNAIHDDDDDDDMVMMVMMMVMRCLYETVTHNMTVDVIRIDQHKFQ
jgi:hypothetical protein